MASRRKHIPQYVHDSYFSNINLERLKGRVDEAAKNLRGLKFDAIAFTGMSGALLAPPLAVKLGKTLIMVRKRGTKSHSKLRVEGDQAAKTYIIVDDFQESGETARQIRADVAKFAPHAKLLGIYEMHHQYRYETKSLQLTPVKEED